MKAGFALRSTVFHPSLILKIAPLLERADCDSIWFPQGRRYFDALDICAVAIGSTRKMRVATGVIRAGEHDPAYLTTRVHTLSESSEGRFVLGLGAGQERGQAAIGRVEALAKMLKATYAGRPRPSIFFAALRGEMLRAALSSADGALMNFCPPSHVERIAPKGALPKDFTLACYVKLFFAESDATARKMLAEEFANYNGVPSYHDMFKQAGVADAIAGLKPGSEIPEELLDIPLANPTRKQTAEFLKRFARAGVQLPILYPYVSGDERYQMAVVKDLASVIADAAA